MPGVVCFYGYSPVQDALVMSRKRQDGDDGLFAGAFDGIKGFDITGKWRETDYRNFGFTPEGS